VSATTPPRLRAPSLLRRLAYWLEPRWRDPGWLAFALNRFAGYILIGYLLAHMVVLSRLAAGPAGWNSLLDLFGSTPFLVGDTLLIAAVVFHGLNGLRVAAFTAGWGVRHPNAWVAVVLAVSVALVGLAAWEILL
jgi:succinate dehydrogenase / fumarate reductase cytochrome b subunit